MGSADGIVRRLQMRTGADDLTAARAACFSGAQATRVRAGRVAIRPFQTMTHRIE
jgi:hypothetical protein